MLDHILGQEIDVEDVLRAIEEEAIVSWLWVTIRDWWRARRERRPRG